MTATQKFLVNGASTFIIGMLAAVWLVYAHEGGHFHVRSAKSLFMFAFALGIIVMPLHVLINLALHFKGFVRINHIPVSYLISQSIVLIGTFCLGGILIRRLPDAFKPHWENDVFVRPWYMEVPSLLFFSFVPLLIFTVLTGRWLQRLRTTGPNPH